MHERGYIFYQEKKEGMGMMGNVNNDCDIGRFVLEGMMTIFIVLIFLFIVQNWVLTNTGETSFAPTCSLTDTGTEIGTLVPYETNKIMMAIN